MDSSDTAGLQSQEPSNNSAEVVPQTADDSMQDYYNLQKELFLTTSILTGAIFCCVWGVYSLPTAASYLLGSLVGFVYLRLLAKNVERVGTQGAQISKSRLGLVIAMVIVATQLDQLQFMPAFLGFLTYKLALLVYTLRVTLL